VQAEFDHGNDIITLSNSNQNQNVTDGIDTHHHHHHDHTASCIICLVDYAPGDPVYRNYPYCEHLFHTSCIQQWVQQQQQQQQQSPMTTTNITIASNSFAECPCCRCRIHSILTDNQQMMGANRML
jgi:hypothetical protein